MKKKLRLSLSTTQVILLSFLLTILLGSALLSLPCATASGQAVSYIDALFTATTATCVTGLVTLPTVSTWSIFGQIVILLLIQVGGLGIITITSALMLLLQRKIGLKDSHLIRDAFNLNTLSGLGNFIKKVIGGTLLIESLGALLYMTVFISEFGARGIWISIFNAVSAFCNAGIDIIAENSLCNYATNPVVNAVTGTLIVLGGIGYIVWWDVLRIAGLFRREGIKCLHKLTLHSKIALSTTAILIVGGAAAILACEYNNPATIGNYNLFDKIQISLFQSVTTRTAGFATVPQESLTDAGALVCLLLMFIGGSPVGTAGGVKTVTVAVLAIAAVATIRNKNEIGIFQRTISKQAIDKAIAVVGMSFSIMFLSTVLLSLTTNAAVLDILYETVSATATVGLTRAFTPTLNLWGRLIIIATMYLGRVGPISLAIAFQIKKDNQNQIHSPTEEVSVG